MPEVTPCVRSICLYFGSFNPLHRGHIALARYAREQLGFDEVWLVLSPVNPHKDRRDQLPYSLRAELIVDALAEYSGLSLCRIEEWLPAPHYTVRSLRALRMLHPTARLSLLIGADNLLGITRWYAWERLLHATPLYVYPRPGHAPSAQQAAPQLPDYTHIVYCTDAPELDISSSEIRDALHRGIDLSHQLPKPNRWHELKAYLGDRGIERDLHLP